LKGVSSRPLTPDGLEVLEGGRPAHIKEVLAHATIARAPALAANEVSDLVLYGDALA
jgi:hypothetical protein